MRTQSALILASLRKLMVANKVSAYIIPSIDAHNSEYIAAKDKRRQFVSGFSGSAGTAIVTHKQALLWTDKRYHLQAENELDPDLWTLMREGFPGVLDRGSWLSKNMEPGSSVGVDPFLVPINEWKSLESKLNKNSVVLKPVTENLIDKIWSGEQPDYPENPVLPLEMEFAGETWESKIEKCRKEMKKKECNCLVLSALDDIAWVLNLRGSDIQFNPVFFAYVVITESKVILFINEGQISSQVKNHLAPKNSVNNIVEFKGYGDIMRYLEELSKGDDKKVWFSKTVSYGLASLVPSKKYILEVTPVTLMKAIKNETEIQGFIDCHVRDGAALCCYLAWLEKHVDEHQITEISGAKELLRLRSEMDNFVGPSFETISGSGPNGAIIHYRPKEETNRQITRSEMYLIDSGAQYKDGTTDVTRTVHLGTPTAYQKECFTRVLSGHIRLARSVFPKKILGNFLDSFARSSLWEAGLEYGHGTGHGVGSYLNVHEGPSGISWRPYPDDPGLEENMIFSNEPGYYEPGKFGIRIENLVRVINYPTKFNNGRFLSFENLTLVPIQQKLIDPSFLTKEDIDYLNDYHEICREKVGSLLREMQKKDELEWLMKETEPMG